MGSIIYLKNGDGKIELKNRHELKTFLSNSENKNNSNHEKSIEFIKKRLK